MPDSNSRLTRFLLPRTDRRYLLRLLLVALCAFVIFKFILIPFRVQGVSMAPTYHHGDFNFGFTLHYTFTPLKRHDIVLIRMAGREVMLLKRVVGLAGETVAFKNGTLIVDGRPIDEPYVKGEWDWTLSPRTVEGGHVYVVGDNRRVSMDRHDFGQTPVSRIEGAPLW
ncbi:MAG: signal peptidase I [Thermodesulfobacteriota bacterium]